MCYAALVCNKVEQVEFATFLLVVISSFSSVLDKVKQIKLLSNL